MDIQKGSKRKSEFKMSRMLRRLTAAMLLILAIIVASCQERCNCGSTTDDSLARLQVFNIGHNRVTAFSFDATGREDGYHVSRSFTRGQAPGAYSVKYGFAFAVTVDIGCAAYFRHPLPGLTDGDEFTLYVQMRVFDLGEDDEHTRPANSFVGPWSDEVAVTCARVYLVS